MKIKIKIKVKATDIARGIPKHPCRCMLARPIRRALQIRDVMVHPSSHRKGNVLVYFPKGKTKDISLPAFVNKLALKFDDFVGVGGRDRLKKIKPFSFVLKAQD